MSEANETTPDDLAGLICQSPVQPVKAHDPVTINELTKLVWAHDGYGRIVGIDTTSDRLACMIQVDQGDTAELCRALNALPVAVAIAQETVETLRFQAADPTDDGALLADRFERLLTEAGVKL